MIKKFFDYITIKPNYVVEYQSKTGAYNFVQSTESYLDKLVNEKEHIVIAYDASKSHPSTPVLVRVSMYGLRPHAISDNRIEFRSVSVERVNENGDQLTAGFPIEVHQLKSSADCPKDNLVKWTKVAFKASDNSPESLASFLSSLSQSAISIPAINIPITK